MVVWPNKSNAHALKVNSHYLIGYQMVHIVDVIMGIINLRLNNPACIMRKRGIPPIEETKSSQSSPLPDKCMRIRSKEQTCVVCAIITQI
ncbi:hypothetical protein KFK09_017370 [Dendrobium nobile]|uniref:Uncharacterized protein n=1 Tax=Dendrobium nobile TaxID=94219 RepID=A0A8T3B215_DENNO|nr:hypothetical protein KFK09_017370 [Dendrobium nobile]